MKKKIIAVSLITAMVVCNSMTVWAADEWRKHDSVTVYDNKNDGGNADRVVGSSDGQKDVKGTINLASAGKSYVVTIAWGDLTYSKDSTGSKSTWKSETADYIISNSNKVWNATTAGTTDIITVTNKSNAGIDVTFTGAIDPTMTEAYGISDGAIKIDGTASKDISLVASTTADGVTGTGTVTVEGTVTKAKELTNSGVVLGTVTVAISHQEE